METVIVLAILGIAVGQSFYRAIASKKARGIKFFALKVRYAKLSKERLISKSDSAKRLYCSENQGKEVNNDGLIQICRGNLKMCLSKSGKQMYPIESNF